MYVVEVVLEVVDERIQYGKEEEVGQRGQEEERVAVVGKKIAKMKHEASIEDRSLFYDL